MKRVYLETVLADSMGISPSLLKKAAKEAGIGVGDRRLVLCSGKKRAAYSVAGIRKLVRWLSDKKNAPRAAEQIKDRRLALLLEGAEVVEGQNVDCAGSQTASVPVLPFPGGFPLPEKLELEISGRISRNQKIILCMVPQKKRAEYSAAFQQRGIDLDSTRLRVLVRSHQNYVNGMLLPVEWVESDLFRCIAMRNPRFNGRW